MKAAMKYVLDIFKAHQKYTKKTIDYLKIQGLRPDPIRESLESETISKYNFKSGMISDRAQCDLLENMLRFANAKSCIEVGVFTGASALSIARGIGPDGKLLALELDGGFIGTAKKYWAEAGVDGRIEVILGPALENLDKLIAQGKEGTFDFAYIDANKEQYTEYYKRAFKLIRIGGMIALDNVLLANSVADYDIKHAMPVALRELNKIVINDPKVRNVILPIADGINFVTKIAN
ncbi:hypothetical protein SteCoe_22106 [Stentor coeruleus]|uniref:Caffeoyl-CoA O-methyltransferase n=1 Tax=Stentor coeruleus TaxID=5963 RepID=A0A1R2BNI6_9CILI|nr:hypothetical protein SteCoe_22106 [Stentor coeruleus]